MSVIRTPVSIVALVVVVAFTSSARAATIPVSGWAVHNGTSTVGGTAANPTFTAADNITVMAPFEPVTLANNGDFVEATTTLTMNARSTTGINTLNTQLRIGIFNGPAGAVVAGDIPNLGFIIEYTNAAAGGLIREQTNAAQTAPFVSPTDRGNGTQDAGANSIQGANPGPVAFTLKLTRNGSTIDLTGSISGTDAGAAGAQYLANYSLSGLAATNFTFNRIGLFLGDGVNAASASLANSSITVVPEPSWLGLAGVAGLSLFARRRW